MVLLRRLALVAIINPVVFNHRAKQWEEMNV
jgi:hypothetical protein